MSSFFLILILLWIAFSTIVVLFIVMLSSRLGKDELDMQYQETFENETKNSVKIDLKDPCTQL
jgi:uncharacterized ion transporter superfamily protein YfcC